MNSSVVQHWASRVCLPYGQEVLGVFRWIVSVLVLVMLLARATAASSMKVTSGSLINVVVEIEESSRDLVVTETQKYVLPRSAASLAGSDVQAWIPLGQEWRASTRRKSKVFATNDRRLDARDRG